MAIVPKRKHSQARRDKRRSNVWKLEAPTLVKCPQCGELKVPHQVCGKCGYYKGEEVVKRKRRKSLAKGRAMPSPFFIEQPSQRSVTPWPCM